MLKGSILTLVRAADDLTLAEELDLLARVELLIFRLDITTRPNVDFNYKATSSPDRQAWDGYKIIYDPKLTGVADMLHELAHWLVCRKSNSGNMHKENWGLTLASVDEECQACDTEVGLRILWGIPWRGRATLLNMPDWWEGITDNPEDAVGEAIWIREEKRLAEFAQSLLG